MLFSDERLKTKIKSTGLKTEDKVPIKTFEYKTNPGVPWVGVMAQDVLKKKPDAVYTDPVSGIKMIAPEFAPIRIGKSTKKLTESHIFTHNAEVK